VRWVPSARGPTYSEAVATATIGADFADGKAAPLDRGVFGRFVIDGIARRDVDGLVIPPSFTATAPVSPTVSRDGTAQSPAAPAAAAAASAAASAAEGEEGWTMAEVHAIVYGPEPKSPAAVFVQFLVRDAYSDFEARPLSTYWQQKVPWPPEPTPSPASAAATNTTAGK
jgi:hypothetical protein